MTINKCNCFKRDKWSYCWPFCTELNVNRTVWSVHLVGILLWLLYVHWNNQQFRLSWRYITTVAHNVIGFVILSLSRLVYMRTCLTFSQPSCLILLWIKSLIYVTEFAARTLSQFYKKETAVECLLAGCCCLACWHCLIKWNIVICCLYVYVCVDEYSWTVRKLGVFVVHS